MKYKIASFALGFAIWLLATIAFRLYGHQFFLVENFWICLSLYLALIPTLGLISQSIFRRYDLEQSESVVAAALLVLPGMIMDSFVITKFQVMLPNMPESYADEFGAWLLWAYSVVLISGFVWKGKDRSMIQT